MNQKLRSFGPAATMGSILITLMRMVPIMTASGDFVPLNEGRGYSMYRSEKWQKNVYICHQISCNVRVRHKRVHFGREKVHLSF